MSVKVRIGVTVLDSAVGLPLPRYATIGSAGLDLHSALSPGEIICIKSGERALIPTGLSFSIPAGYEGQVRARSGLAVKYGIGLVNAPGTIDSDYRGEVRVLVINWGQEEFTVQRGDRIAQLVISPVAVAELFTVSDAEVDETERGSGGFGSTGVSA